MTDAADALPVFPGSKEPIRPTDIRRNGALHFDRGPFFRVSGDMRNVSVDTKRPDKGDTRSAAVLRGFVSQIQRETPPRELVVETQNAYLPSVKLPSAYVGMHRALEATSAKFTAPPTVRSSDASEQSPQQLRFDRVVPLTAVRKLSAHPLESGPAIVPEDRLGRDLEEERSRDAKQRLKHEIYSNKLRGRKKMQHFSELSRGFTTAAAMQKPEFKFFYDGDDFRFLWRKAMWQTMVDIRRGRSTLLGQDLDAERSKALARFVERVSKLAAPETFGDVQRLLAEQRALAADLDQDFASTASQARLSARRRRQAGLADKFEPYDSRVREVFRRAVPFVHRLIAKRKQKRRQLFPDELALEARADVLQARETLRADQARVRQKAFGDDKLGTLLAPRTPLEMLPDHRRPSDLQELAAPGDLDDPREKGAFRTARDTSEPTPEEDLGRPVSGWELAPAAGMASWRIPVAAKISAPFDYARASDRVMKGLQEKALADWRPPEPAWMEVFRTSVQRRGNFDRRPGPFWDSEKPDLRTTTEWDDLIGAPFLDDNPNRGVDRQSFYDLRARWEVRKRLAIAWRLDPKPNETLEERNNRRRELDEKVARVVLDQSDTNLLSALWYEDAGPRLRAFGTRPNNRVGPKDTFHPLNLRDRADILKASSFSTSGISAQVDGKSKDLTAEEMDEHNFLVSWLEDDTTQLSMRETDSRVSYLAESGLRVNRQTNATQPDRPRGYMQLQDSVWEYRVYRGLPEPGPRERSWLAPTDRIDTRGSRWWEEGDARARKQVEEQLSPEYRIAESEESRGGLDLSGYKIQDSSDDLLGQKTPQEVDKWMPDDDGAKDGYELPREMTYPVDVVNNTQTRRWLCKTPWDRIAAYDLTSKMMRPEEDGRYQDLGPSFYFHRNRLHYRRMPVQRLRHYGAELREAKDLSERLVPQEMASAIKNYYAIARHSQVPFFSKHVTRNSPKYKPVPKVNFSSAGLTDDTEDYVRVNPHLSKWANM
eukprot:TRINITY_DN35610_c0_g1_i1.p1 TRINITY_DN35610_c0_g1~~TRINITY_DN35610_c0_g1_i1.p1  ORF type:complete len:1103 (+),score=240.26 TRINITY_DN35610_c0_g1_i1:323-3310(+)